MVKEGGWRLNGAEGGWSCLGGAVGAGQVKKQSEYERGVLVGVRRRGNVI